MEQANTLSRALGLLRRAGVRITGGNLERMTLMLPDSTVREVRIHTGAAVRTRCSEPGLLVVTERPSKGSAESARSGAYDLITIEPETVIIAGRALLETAAQEPVRRRRNAWGRWALMRTLILARSPMTQRCLAEAAGISQPAVNKHLKALGPAVTQGPGGWSAADRTELIRQWLEAYPASSGASTYWYSLESPMAQARAAAGHAQAVNACPLISGSAAADIYAPWALPGRFRIYTESMVDFTAAGFVPSSPEEATMTVTIPEDRTLWQDPFGEREDMLASSGLPLADPLTVLADVMAQGGPDSVEAARVLAEWIGTGRPVSRL